MIDAPQTTGVFQPPNWHFPGIAVKGDDAFRIAAWLDDYAKIAEARGDAINGVKLHNEVEIRRMAKLFKSCEVKP